VAVGRRPRGVKRSERAVRAGAMLDDDGLLERNAERLREHAADRVAGAAGSEDGDEGDRLARVVVGAERRAEQCRRGGHENEQQLFHAWVLPGWREFCFGGASASRAARLVRGSMITDLRDHGGPPAWARLSQP